MCVFPIPFPDTMGFHEQKKKRGGKRRERENSLAWTSMVIAGRGEMGVEGGRGHRGNK